MSAGLLSQLDRYYAWVDDAQDPIDPAEVASLIVEPAHPIAISAPIGQRRGWNLAAVVAAGVLVLAGAAALLSTTARSAPPAATPLRIASPAELTWVRVPDAGATLGRPSEQSMFDVVEWDSQLVAVGSDGSDAAVWVSSDGVEWSKVPHDESVFDGQGASMAMASVTVAGPGLVAVGASEGPGAYSRAVVWTSEDGVSWSRVPHDPLVFGTSSAYMADVTVGGPGLVAVGRHGNNAAVWTSADGSEWSRLPHDEAVFGGRFYRSMSRVAPGGPGLVAVGGRRFIDSFLPAVWTSRDGITWSQVADNGDLFDGCRGGMSAVAAKDTNLFAIGIGSNCESTNWAVWSASDGVKWFRRSEGPVLGRGNAQWMNDLAAGSYGLIAVGGELVGDRSSPAVWTSLDGITWARVQHDDQTFDTGEIHRLIETSHGFIAVGQSDSDAAVWIGAER